MDFPPGGPWVTMAVLCERVEPRADGSVDVFGIVDGVVVEPEQEDPLGVKPVARLSLTALVSIRAGDVRGTHVLALRAAYPSGSAGPGLERPIELTDATPGASLIVPLDFEVDEPGVYSFDVRFDERMLTRINLWVAFAGAERSSDARVPMPGC